MMHDPFQTYSTLGAYPGTMGASGVNPMLGGGISQFGQQPGFQGYGGQIQHPLQQQLQQQQLQQQLVQQQLVQQQLHLAAILAQAANPQLSAVTGWHNPLATIALLQNPLLNPVLAQHYQQQQQQYPQLGYGGSPFGQIGSPFGQTGYPLAPQSWVGQQGFGGGSPFGLGQGLLPQLGGRGFQGHGISPWSGF